MPELVTSAQHLANEIVKKLELAELELNESAKSAAIAKIIIRLKGVVNYGF